uniref:hypothetical protein n=1 Tax=Pararhizobium sp. IMCC3301 TaxID=3067904 RepID=UPI0027415E81|nr:hypothetical protein [Pararhizobium sp. IMCC3301]
MMKSSALFHLWQRQIFLRNWHEEFEFLLSLRGYSSGIYLIACAGEIVYVGQSWDLARRSIESLGNHYHRIADTSLPWSIAFAPCRPNEMDERESTAIRSYAPGFNTSIPSVAKSQSRMPEVVGVAAVFQDQEGPCGAFAPENLKLQIEEAEANPEPPWKAKKKRRQPIRPETPHIDIQIPPVEWSQEDSEELVLAYGVSLSEPLRFKINLCDDGSVVSRDGECIGTWEMDENAHPSFYPEGASELLFYDVFLGRLCQRITEWHETNSDEAIG